MKEVTVWNIYGFIFQNICFCDISQVYHQYTLSMRCLKQIWSTKVQTVACGIETLWYSLLWRQTFYSFYTEWSSFHICFFSIIIYLASDINIVLIYIIFFITLPLWQKKTIKKNIYNNTNETLLNWYRKTKQMNNKNYSNKRP